MAFIETDTTARYEHDCDECDFLGRFEGDDLYFCDIEYNPTVISRHSSRPDDYISGMDFVEKIPVLAIAHTLAVRRGLY